MPLSVWMAVFLCLEQLVDLLPVITRRAQLFGKRDIRFDRELGGRLVANIANACAICQHPQCAPRAERRQAVDVVAAELA